jgi:hypothetical protein
LNNFEVFTQLTKNTQHNIDKTQRRMAQNESPIPRSILKSTNSNTTIYNDNDTRPSQFNYRKRKPTNENSSTNTVNNNINDISTSNTKKYKI